MLKKWSNGNGIQDGQLFYSLVHGNVIFRRVGERIEQLLIVGGNPVFAPVQEEVSVEIMMDNSHRLRPIEVKERAVTAIELRRRFEDRTRFSVLPQNGTNMLSEM